MIFEEALTLTEPFDDVVDRVVSAFADQGFGVITEIDMKATLKDKIDEDIDHLMILGMCSPGLANEALKVVPHIGVLLPCNVVVRETDAGVMVEVMDPGLMATLTGDPRIEQLADHARELVNTALASVSAL
ncbi:MAG: DUF302 domain-containing protein [Actinomycetia bacterium]|nr:DUF302 domain-containing protein [Actinomycetes bacterium]MCP4959837.1 DUF302 domain-containing protein [Actinomycetes bacterium]